MAVEESGVGGEDMTLAAAPLTVAEALENEEELMMEMTGGRWPDCIFDCSPCACSMACSDRQDVPVRCGASYYRLSLKQ
jgi:hypothetical protein